jgi:hypothetical protein
MTRMHIPPWAVVAAALLAPAALHAQGGAVVCRDGSNGSNASACAQHGGVDSIMTRAAQQNRPSQGVETGRVDSTAGAAKDAGMAGMKADTGMAGMKADTTLKAKPGLQTGKAKRHYGKMTADSMHQMHDSAKAAHDSTH